MSKHSKQTNSKTNNFEIANNFEIEGRFLGFAIAQSDSHKYPSHSQKPDFKYINLETAEGTKILKLSKAARLGMNRMLIVGDLLSCVGEQKLDRDGEFQLKILDLKSINSLTNSQTTLNIVQDRQIKDLQVKESISQLKSKPQINILICQKSDCLKRGAGQVCQALQTALSDRALSEQVSITQTGCLKRCKEGANLVIMPFKSRYSHVTTAQIPQILTEIC